MTTTDETQAAEPILDATEPAPAEDATQSIYAWSEHNDDDTVLIQRRSWKIPVALAVLATAAAVTTGVVMMWPAHKASLPAQTPSVAAAPSVVVPPSVVAPPPPLSPDELFINTLNAGIKDPAYKPAQQGDPQAILMGHDVCTKMSNLYRADSSSAYGELEHQMTAATGMPGNWADAIILSSVRAYCPQYAN